MRTASDPVIDTHIIIIIIFWPCSAALGSDSVDGGAEACFFVAPRRLLSTHIPVLIMALWIFPKKLVGFRRTSPALCTSAGPCFPLRGARGHDCGQLPSSSPRGCFCPPTYAPSSTGSTYLRAVCLCARTILRISTKYLSFGGVVKVGPGAGSHGLTSLERDPPPPSPILAGTCKAFPVRFTWDPRYGTGYCASAGGGEER